ncbi:SIR2 family protein [Ancylobacter sp. MQZ15Z-1]|uniref:SIR2 family protein n=1 Tax=Ancylobacter mangrovi TaxID=2972472 RepID=A0A9X2PDX2_9HYPH|nr:SIR2 family protein [Ancylobacter mangrovi]MCS0495589.1 SIR2 family protein [Ancylobacter mangrovi]
MDSSEPVLLLGAGASITSGIPAAAKTVEKVARWAWCKENGRHPDDFTIRRSDYWPWLTAQPWYRPELSPADLYPDAIDNLLGVKSDRREFFEKLINPPEVPPSRGYVALTQILHQGWISTVLTTNFDRCLERAAIQQNRPHRLVSISTPADYVMFNSAPHDPQLVFLHGSVKHYTDKNLTDEVQSLDPLLVERLRPLLRDHPVITVGYRGAEASVMNDLFLAQAKAGSFLHGVYWCVLENDLAGPHSPSVEQLAATIGSNFQLVPIRGFDDLFEKDLLASMIAAGARPTRRPSGHSVGGMPADMRPLDGLDLSGFEQPLLQARLRQYADRTDLWRPGDIDAAWVEEMTDRLDLVRPVGGSVTPTLAGWLLFSRNPSVEFPQARVEFCAMGPGHWLRGRFGEDVELEPTARDDEFTVRRTITGNLWSQLDDLIDLLALVNFQFRLKAEVSRTVNAYNAIAIKEMLVNAIVHRDYDRDEAVQVVVEPKSITVISPGGLIEEIAVQVAGQSFQDAIAERTSPIKGYRNPAISDLFYGGGQMDRRGSGLSDMVLATVNNNGSVSFGPSADNTRFTVTLEARPEAVDEITNTALPMAEETVRYSSNLIAIESMPAKVWHAATSAGSNRSFYRAAEGLAVPPGHVSDGRFYSLYDLEELAEVMVTPFDPGEIEALDFNELIEMPGGESVALKLLHELLFEHLKTKGLQIEYDRRRAYFARGDEPELKVSYQGRLRKATRTVVKARTKRDSDDIVYYEHKAVSFSVLRFGSDWAVVLTPGYAFTRDGLRNPISRERTNALSTRRAARDFNPSVLQDVSFWLAILSGEAEGLFALEHRPDNDLARFAPSVLLSHRMPTISFNVSAFNELAQRDTEIDEDLQRLDDELEALALEPDEEDGGGLGRDGDDPGEGEPDDVD